MIPRLALRNTSARDTVLWGISLAKPTKATPNQQRINADCGDPLLLDIHPNLDTPEKHLVMSIFERAVLDLGYLDSSLPWFLSKDASWPFSFESVCAYLGLDAEAVRAEVKRKHHGRHDYKAVPPRSEARAVGEVARMFKRALGGRSTGNDRGCNGRSPRHNRKAVSA